MNIVEVLFRSTEEFGKLCFFFISFVRSFFDFIDEFKQGTHLLIKEDISGVR